MPSSEVAKQTRDQITAAAQAGVGNPTVFDLLKQQQPAIERALPQHIDGERFARIAVTLVRQTPKLLECTPLSFIGSLMVAAQLGLEPGPPLGLSWLIPRYNSKTRKLEAGFQIGYHGVVELFRRSGEFLAIQAFEVCENDAFDYEYGLTPALHHKPPKRGERGHAYAYYCIARFKDGGSAFIVLSREEVEKRRARGEDGPAWRTDYDAMAKKTTVMALKPWLPLAPELERQLATDGRTFRDGPEPNMADAPSSDLSDDGTIDAEIVDEPPTDPKTGEVTYKPGEEPFETADDKK